MKNVLLAIAMAAMTVSVSAAPADLQSLTNYAKRALTLCPDSMVKVEPFDQQGPAGFLIFKVTLTSSDKYCGTTKLLFYSPATQQVLIGTTFALVADSRPVEVRLTETASEILKQPIKATVSAFPLPDGLRAAAMNKQTPLGTFAYHGYVDASNHFLLVATRGNLNTDPGKTLLESLGAQSSGVWRGNKLAKNVVVELSDFQCPTCGRAHKTLEPLIAKHLNNVYYARLDLPLFEHHEWAAQAALGARAINKLAPSHYWSYVDFIYQNQETIDKGKNFDEVLKNFCEDHDINWKPIEKFYRSPAERQLLLDQTGRAFDNGVTSTPTYIINGQMIGYGPEGKFTIDAVKAAIGVK